MSDSLRTLRIAQVSPLMESVPPTHYGGSERVVAYLTDALLDLGHEVTLYASGDSRTRARLRAGCGAALRLNPGSVEPAADHTYMLERVFQDQDEFDVIHSHVGYLAFPLLRRMRTPHLSTFHGPFDVVNFVNLKKEFTDIPLVSISRSQQTQYRSGNWGATIYHGLPEHQYEFQEKDAGYLCFLGRFSPEKGVDTAIDIATRAGMPLKMAGKVDAVDREFFEKVVEPRIDGVRVQYVGESTEREKRDLLAHAKALLFPIRWREPFGLVMIEALACGTPVIATRYGSVPEVIDHGATGFIVGGVRQAVRAVVRVHEISRRACRSAFEKRFTARKMAENYVRVYRNLIAERKRR